MGPHARKAARRLSRAAAARRYSATVSSSFWTAAATARSPAGPRSPSFFASATASSRPSAVPATGRAVRLRQRLSSALSCGKRRTSTSSSETASGGGWLSTGRGGCERWERWGWARRFAMGSE
eukprot:7378647-Prymnesium_polylepis.2